MSRGRAEAGIVADDLTGLLACVAAFAARLGPLPAVLWDNEGNDPWVDEWKAPIIGFDLGSRHLSENAAHARAIEWTERVELSETAPVLVKIDSRLAGHPGCELTGILKGLG